MVDRELQQVSTMLHDGAYGPAEQRLQNRLTLSPEDAQAHRLMSLLASATGRVPLALKHMSRAVDLTPDSPELRFQLGCLTAHSGDYGQALQHFRMTTAALPGMADGWYFLGISLIRMHRDLEAMPPLRRAYELAPDNIKVLEALAELEFRVGYPADALPLWQRLSDLRPQDLHTILKKGEAESRMGFFDRAAQTFRAALEQAPHTAELLMALAQAEEDNGNRDSACAAYREALALRPQWALPMAGLLALERGESSGQLIEEASGMLHDGHLADADRALIGYALGRARDARGEYELAWKSWGVANQARQRTSGPPDPGVLAQQVQKTIAEFGRTTDSGHASSGSEDERFIFIVGMPRSGTTLTEQIIAAHPQAHACGELPDIALIVRNLPSRFTPPLPWPELASSLDRTILLQECERYSAAAGLHAPVGALRLVDKEPLNFHHLGLIAMMFPRARIIWCRRDPRDVAVSIYGENFALSERLATSVEGIGHYINQQDRLMRHWISTLRVPILTLQYEQLVSSMEMEARRIVDFVGLPWDDACLDFHLSQRSVQTPSRWQVKQPVHNRSIGRWRNYQDGLAPLLDVLEPGTY